MVQPDGRLLIDQDGEFRIRSSSWIRHRFGKSDVYQRKMVGSLRVGQVVPVRILLVESNLKYFM
jgi:hypothetical protein